MTTIIQKWGNSQGIRIPKILLDNMNWKENEQVIILVQDDKLIIEKDPNKKRKNIKELFKDFEGDYNGVEIDWGEPEGREIW